MARSVYDVTVSVCQATIHFSELWKNYIGTLGLASQRDIQLCAQDGSAVWVHKCVLLPLCPWLADIVQGATCCGFPKVILDCVSKATLTAVVELLYTGRCHLVQRHHHAWVMETVARLGINLASNSIQVVEIMLLDLRRGSSQSVELLDSRQLDAGEQRRKGGGEQEAEIIHFEKGKEDPDEDQQILVKMENPLYQQDLVIIMSSEVQGRKNGGRPHAVDLERRTLVYSRKKIHSCNICTKSFSLGCHLKDHMLTHSGEKPHICNICMKDFSLPWNLKTHMLTHSREKPHICNICSKAFALAGTLKDHKLTHNGKKPHCCNVCTKSFTRASKLEHHKLMHNHPA